MSSKETTLEDLVGLHMLDAVDFETVPIKPYEGASYDEDSQTCRFRLDGTLWAAVEDPGDGYRSSMRELKHLRKGSKVSNAFPPVQVLAIYRTDAGYEKCDVLEFYATSNGKLLLAVGTRNTDDYYPSFVAAWSPENMPGQLT